MPVYVVYVFRRFIMKQIKLLQTIVLVAGAFCFSHAINNSPENFQKTPSGKIIDGSISSVDIEHNMFVMKTRITKIDTIHLNKSAVIKSGRVVAGRKDLKPDKYVKANYEIIQGKKFATAIVTYPEGSFLPDTTELGKDVLIAEGTIQSIDDTGTVMVLKAPIEKEYIFTLDPGAIIRSGKKSIPLMDLKPNYEIQVIYSEKGSRNIATSVNAQSK